MQYTYSVELRDKLPDGVKDMDNLLKQRVAEGVADVTLKRELHRLNEERDKMKFHQFREHAKEWLDSGKNGKKTAIQEEHTTSTELQELRDLVQEQKKRLDEFQGNMHQQQANPQQEFNKEPFTCHYCGGPNHFKRLALNFKMTKVHLVGVDLLIMVEVEVHLNFRVGAEAKEAFTEEIPEVRVDLEEEVM